MTFNRTVTSVCLVLLSYLGGGGGPLPARADDAGAIRLMVFERSPYYTIQPGGGFGGLVAKPAGDAFRDAGVEFEWSVVAANRQLKIIRENTRRTCAVGWFKKPEREEYAKFTDPIYQNRPLVAIARSDNAGVSGHQSLKGLLGDKGLVLGRRLGFSYGVYMDGMIGKSAPTAVTSSQDNVGMARMLRGERFDYMFAAFEEAAEIVASPASGGGLAIRPYSEIPDGNKRYILCSGKVGDETIARLNTAIGGLARREPR